MRNLLKLIAYQMGSEVSYEELGKQIGISKNTVENYLNLLQKVFVLYRLGGYSKNLRKEVTKSSKWYFTDNGILNAYEIKKGKKSPEVPKAFSEAYPDAAFHVVNAENYLDYV